MAKARLCGMVLAALCNSLSNYTWPDGLVFMWLQALSHGVPLEMTLRGERGCVLVYALSCE